MEFVGRNFELKQMKEFYSFSGQDGMLLYGRRRVGKSELVKESLKSNNLRSIYYECTDASEQSNLDALCELIGASFQIPKPSFSRFFDAIEYLFAQAEIEPMVLVLDEYPYLRDKIEGCDSLFQAIIDNHAMKGKMKFIVCGSFVKIMQGLNGEGAPLHKRFGWEINLQPMDHKDAALFYPSFSNEDKLRLYSVFGGMPFYNRYIDERKSAKQNIIDLLLSPSGRFHGEVDASLRLEIGKMVNANEVFLTIGKGFHKFADILSQSKVSSSPTLADVLKKLVELGLVRKTHPINDDSEKKSLYEIEDRLCRFYFMYLLPRKSYLAVMDPEIFFQRFIEKDFEEKYVPKEFEEAAKSYLIRKNRQGLIDPPLLQVGTYYYDDPLRHKNGQFDVVTFDGGHYRFYEVKFTCSPLETKVYKEEERQIQDCGIEGVELGFFSRSGYQGDWPNVPLYTIDDVYSE